MPKKIEPILIKPYDVWIQPNIDALEPSWWHKLLFWKKWKYADWFQHREFISINQLLEKDEKEDI